MGREVGGRIGMGKTCEPKAFSFQCMTKFTTKNNNNNNNNKIKDRVSLIVRFMFKKKKRKEQVRGQHVSAPFTFHPINRHG